MSMLTYLGLSKVSVSIPYCTVMYLVSHIDIDVKSAARELMGLRAMTVTQHKTINLLKHDAALIVSSQIQVSLH